MGNRAIETWPSVCFAGLLTFLIGASAALARPLDIDGPFDQFGQPFHLSAHSEDRLVVVAFLGLECPLAGLYANRLNELCETYSPRGVAFVAVNSNRQETQTAMAAFAARLRFTMIKDEGQMVADAFGATRSPEVFLLDADREVVYRGRIDDQYAPGIYGRAAPTRRDLEEAINAALESLPIAVPETEPVGCYLDRAAAHSNSTTVTYAKDIAPIFDTHCAHCHRPGEAAPFSLLTYDDALAWRDTIREVVEQRRMPPWGAVGGHFANDPSLDDRERATLYAWLDAGCPQGNPADRPTVALSSGDWSIRPDRVLTMPGEFAVPKEGVLDYQQFALDPKFSEDTWIQAVEIRPGNRSIVHHVNVYAKPKNARASELFINRLGDYYLAMAVPGNTVTAFPAGTAKLIPAGWDIVLEVHYVPNGTEQVDRTSLALALADPSKVRRQMATRAILDDNLAIGPKEKKTVSHTWALVDDYTLFALYPHMHLRGRSMVFDALYPDGRQEVLLNVADYDFAWQYRYVLSTPKNLPRGTRITAVAVYDNTSDNPRNPDPNSTVRAGRQSSDEMYQACLEICRTNEDLIREDRWARQRPIWFVAALATVGILGLRICAVRPIPDCNQRRNRSQSAAEDSSASALNCHTLDGASPALIVVSSAASANYGRLNSSDESVERAVCSDRAVR